VTAVAPGVRDEQELLEEWRLSELVRVGFAYDDAVNLAAATSGPEAVDLHEACELVANGCDPSVAYDILRPAA
jgi:hypothetical protein